ncbi:unnamed protein product [Owenia fusiformis]|uniref:Uncharacterized protein n=1 Tax=Owenia fusiformis TaxID=6347 RepID=A0A8S4PEF5_OWEFU|nr:unnamed protein product [Owenia fusiformis]
MSTTEKAKRRAAQLNKLNNVKLEKDLVSIKKAQSNRKKTLSDEIADLREDFRKIKDKTPSLGDKKTIEGAGPPQSEAERIIKRLYDLRSKKHNADILVERPDTRNTEKTKSDTKYKRRRPEKQIDPRTIATSAGERHHHRSKSWPNDGSILNHSKDKSNQEVPLLERFNTIAE